MRNDAQERSGYVIKSSALHWSLWRSLMVRRNHYHWCVYHTMPVCYIFFLCHLCALCHSILCWYIFSVRPYRPSGHLFNVKGYLQQGNLWTFKRSLFTKSDLAEIRILIQLFYNVASLKGSMKATQMLHPPLLSLMGEFGDSDKENMILICIIFTFSHLWSFKYHAVIFIRSMPGETACFLKLKKLYGALAFLHF